MEEKKINVSISEGDEFFAHEMSVNYNPTQFIFDFRCVTPRVDLRSRESALLNIKHNIVMVEPWHAKEILNVLQNVVNNYEERFGKIEKPKAIKEMEKKQKKMNKAPSIAKTEAPSYLG